MRYIVWPGLIAPVIAPLAGGVITTYASWRWMFVINVPLGVIALGFAWRLITETATGDPPPLDKLGVVLTCGALGCLTYTVAFVILALIALVSAVDALRLHPSAGEALVQAPAR